MLLIGSRHRRGSCSAAYRFARSGNVPADPKVDLDGPDSSLGVHRSPLRRHDGHCVHARLGRRPDFGSGLPRPELVPLLPFLPASAVFYAASGSEDPLVRLSAGLLHPAAGHGVHHVSDSLARSFDRASGPKAVDLAVHPEVVPGGEYPSKRSPPRQPDHVVTALVLSDAIAFTDWCALSPFRAGPAAVSPRCAALLFDLRAFFRRGVRCDARDVAAARPLDAPLGFGSTRSRCCRACRAAQLCWTFRLAARTALASPDPNVEGRQGCFGPVWLPRPVPRASPKGGPQRVAVAPAPPEGSTSAALHHGPRRTDGMPVDPPREEVPPRRSRHPKAQGFRRHRDASPKRLVRDPALAPKSGDRWFELVLPILPRSPAYVMVRPLAADTHARRRARLRATRAHPEGCCVEPKGEIPKDRVVWASRRPTRRCALGGS